MTLLSTWLLIGKFQINNFGFKSHISFIKKNLIGKSLEKILHIYAQHVLHHTWLTGYHNLAFFKLALAIFNILDLVPTA